jgi:chaperonin GroEL
LRLLRVLPWHHLTRPPPSPPPQALYYPMKLIANNAGVNGSVVMQKVMDSNDPNYGYNAATDKFEDLMESGIIDPTKVRALCLCGGVLV